MSMNRSGKWLLPILMAFVVVGCAKNPVTGKNELMLVSEQWELDVGKQQYAPLRQSQGGDYVVDPGVEAYVRKVGNRLAAKSDRKLPYEFNVINSSVPNAWALPGGKISINRGLLTELKSEAELAAVLGHEIVHAAAKHGAQGQSRGLLLQGGVMLATVAGNREGYGQLAQMGSMIGAQLINTRYGREAELESDRFGMSYMSRAGYDPRGAVDLQQTFVRLSEGRNQNFIQGLFASHPPSAQRVAANRATASKLPSGGAVGRKEFEQAISRLRKTESAYKNFDKAQKAAADGKIKEAKQLTQRAIKTEPKESHFHSFLGDIALKQKDKKSAKRHYDKAIALNKNFFWSYVKRGELHLANKNYSAAKADFNRSMQLLPTPTAEAGLGDAERAGGNIQRAKKHYANAAQGNGPAAERAMDSLLKLDLSDNPGAYVFAQHGVTEKGTLGIRFTNRTKRPIGNIDIQVRTSSGKIFLRRTINGTLSAGKSQIVDTGKRITNAQANNVRVFVMDAVVK